MSLNEKIINFLILITVSFASCTLNNKADLTFPTSSKNLMMECYLTPGKNFELRLMESNSFQEDLVLQLTWNAHVTISSEDNDIKLLNILNPNTHTKYIFNYGSPQVVPQTTNSNYSIQIETEDGEKLQATTSTVEFVPIKQIRQKINEIYISFHVPKNTPEKFFTIIAEGKFKDENQTIVEDFDGSNWEEEDITVSLKGNFDDWESIKVKLLHITSQYYDFKKSIAGAYSANIDPFTVPTEMDSNVSGGLGIFTYYTVDSLIIR